MRTLDKDGRLLCELQGKIFESSAAMYGTSSAVFVRRYMNSEYAARMDSPGALDRPTDAHEAFEALNDEYGTSSYGSVTFSSDELFWMGYVYRLWAYVYETSSRSVYRLCNVSELHSLYYAYHTLDPLNAVSRIMETKGLSVTEAQRLEAGVQLLRKIRSQRIN